MKENNFGIGIKGLKVDETDEKVIFIIFVIILSLKCALVLRLGGRDFLRWGAEMRKKRFENLILDVRGGSERQRYSAERVLLDGLTFMSLQRKV